MLCFHSLTCSCYFIIFLLYLHHLVIFSKKKIKNRKKHCWLKKERKRQRAREEEEQKMGNKKNMCVQWPANGFLSKFLLNFVFPMSDMLEMSEKRTFLRLLEVGCWVFFCKMQKSHPLGAQITFGKPKTLQNGL